MASDAIAIALPAVRAGGKRARRALIGVALVFIALFLVLPLGVIFAEAFSLGLRSYAAALADPDVQSALRLTIGIALVAVPLNTIFGLAASWCLARFRFRGRGALIALIELPLSVSPVVAGLLLVLLFGNGGLFGPFLEAHGMRIIFAVPGMVLATIFVTFPYVARELIPLAETQGSEEEEAAVTLGASGWQTFLRVSLPKLRWGLFYGILLCNARAIGEFGAVSVVSGQVPGQTNTLPLEVQALYDGYRVQAAFAASSLLACLAIVTLILKAALEWRHRDEIRATRRMQAG
ncbi:MAG TPA: sulfate ABC transporter permease subunit CysW [Acetobacteraceae bacterium]|nr:sulfate ABC transporter permease subunit CysW [Acetobacteraceae bacterium]